MTGSVATDAGDATRVACGAFKPIYWSAKDTPETAGQVREHNAAGKAICGWGSKK